MTGFKPNPPACDSSIDSWLAKITFSPPADYIQFLRASDGGVGFVGNKYLHLWRVNELIEMNAAYHTEEFAPGLFLFGSDGGGEAFGFDTQSWIVPIVSVPFVGMGRSAIRKLANTFDSFFGA